MAVYPDWVKFEAYIHGVWDDITPDVVGSQKIQYGIMGNGHTDRVAGSGSLQFKMRNDAGCLGGMAGYYSPFVTGSKAGWEPGIPVRLRICYQGASFTKFYGRIRSINPDSGTFGRQRVTVTVLDWMEYAASHPLYLPTIDNNKRIDEIVPILIADIPHPPLNTEYNLGNQSFVQIFDTVKGSTRVMAEMAKIALSELGYIYIKRDQDDGETLVVEGRYTRNADSTLTPVPISDDFAGRVLQEDADYLLQENGARLILSELEDLDFVDSMTSLSVNYGDNIANQVRIRVYPRETDSSPVVLFSLNSPITLSAGETKTGIRGTYRDPSGGTSRVAGKSMAVPVATTDYQMFSNFDGTGTDLTANLSVTANYGAADVYYTLENTGGSAGYVTKLQARGLGIYIYDPVEYIVEDTDSINIHGVRTLDLDMKYETDPSAVVDVASIILNQDKDARAIASEVSFFANYDDQLMRGFLFLDIGDLIHIRESQTGIDSYFYIQGVKAQFRPVGIIHYSWIISEALSLNNEFWVLEQAGRTELGETTILGY
jgi:hypothetical protein